MSNHSDTGNCTLYGSVTRNCSVGVNISITEEDAYHVFGSFKSKRLSLLSPTGAASVSGASPVVGGICVFVLLSCFLVVV